ncbi:MAG: xanthine dehydrogenase family protein subunit M [Hydrogenophaga sp.]|jgi:carbon-monoxide dehydrogenase medium subunit|uniref:FAD binding domain-containing protein n=1 Tax=Hydrogenophaga sp. TaxID=1904254 RepID=UPI000ECCEC2B|nr:xanthine dehydrogenase family protein subunit M [Hydrogenophaga sp.]MDD3786212.1 xanthine dehydrogenase family protein subunit M [Hydrogenophaga sp.]MDX9968529.1 xanthine dehydrogenase family protein subunit M [Hydrogenophaga sp.]HAJ11524.1 carbon monoxide dehydrogenase [Comamonadaceae bacterium]
MYAFAYDKPATLADALQKIATGGQPLAGGQTLIASLKQRLAQPEMLVDLAGVADLAGIRREGSAIVIGAMTRHEAVAGSAEVQQAIPALAALAGGIGDRQVRAMGTLGGSVANNDPAADYPAAVLGLGATVHTSQRQIAADDFFQGMYATALEPGEIITAISFPIPAKAAYAKFRQPASRFALVGVFVAQTAAGVRVAITGAGNGVFRHPGLEAALAGSFSPEAVDGVAIDASELNSDLHASAEYRAQLIKVQTRRAVAQARG